MSAPAEAVPSLSSKKVFTTGEVAKLCKVASRTAAKWFDSGRLKGYRIPGSQDRRIPREQLIRFLKEYGMPLGGLTDGVAVLVIGPEALGVRLAGLLPGDVFRLTQVAGGFDAGTAVAAAHPRAVLIDTAIGRAEAVQIASRLRLIDGTADALLLAVTYEDDADEAGLTAAGFDAVFRHPFDPALLAERLRAAGEGSGQ